jgi:hypothetical protein
MGSMSKKMTSSIRSFFLARSSIIGITHCDLHAMSGKCMATIVSFSRRYREIGDVPRASMESDKRQIE